MNFSRIALPVIGRPIVLRSILDREPGGLAQDPDHDRRGVSAAPEEVAQACGRADGIAPAQRRSEEHTSELQSQSNLVCRLLLEKKKKPLTHYPHPEHCDSLPRACALPVP